MRRKFFDVDSALGSPLANEALDRIAGLYTIEAQIKGKPRDERRRCRQEQSLSLVAELKEWLETTLHKISGKSELAKAMRYALSRWPALCRYTNDGRVEIDSEADKQMIQ